MISTALIGFGGLAYADDDPTSPAPPSSETTDPPPSTETSTPTSEPVEEPAPPKDDEEPADPPANETPELAPPSVSTASACDAGIGFVEVHITNPNDVEETYTVNLGEAQTAEVAVAAGATEVVGFEDVAAGEHPVLVLRGDEVVGESIASVDRCNEIGPVDDPLQVFVRCEDGKGLVTIRVFNTEGESRTYTVSIDDLELPGDIELGANEYAVVIDEVEAPDGTYSVRVVAEGIDHTETVKVACAPVPPTTTSPAAQPRPAPASNNDGLASTGAAVGGMALLAVLALAAGGGLVIASRRRRNPQPESTD